MSFVFLFLERCVGTNFTYLSKYLTIYRGDRFIYRHQKIVCLLKSIYEENLPLKINLPMSLLRGLPQKK